jgi:predicted NodU family carbamoyl transferase
MRSLPIKSGHDGAMAGVDASRGQLLFSYGAEKDSFPRNAATTAKTFPNAGLWFDDLPDLLALSGYAKTGLDCSPTIGAGYMGIGPQPQVIGKKSFFGRTADYCSSTHERAHIWASYALPPFAQGQPRHVLVWDDVLGDFYQDHRLGGGNCEIGPRVLGTARSWPRPSTRRCVGG